MLKNVSFTIEPGESDGIVGKTGSGKTTIVDLLLRTYNVPDGTPFMPLMTMRYSSGMKSWK